MAQSLQLDAAYCFQRAEEFRRLARRATDSAVQQELEQSESHWLSLAHARELAERFEEYEHLARRLVQAA